MEGRSTMKELFNAIHQTQREDFFGQENSKKVVFTMIEAAKKRREQPGHILLYGTEGSGKKYFANIIAQEIGNKVVYIDGRSRVAISPSDLASFLTSIENGNTLIIQDLDKMKLQIIEEILCQAMEENGIDIMIGKGPSARSVRLDLPRFTLIATVSNISMISKRLQNSFELICKMVDYTSADTGQFIKKLSGQLGIPIEEDATRFIADASRGQISRAEKLFKRLRDFAQVEGVASIGLEFAQDRLSMVIEQETWNS